MTLTDESPFPYGKHRGIKMANVPSDYLLWAYESGKCWKEVYVYIESNLDIIKKEYELQKNQTKRP